MIGIHGSQKENVNLVHVQWLGGELLFVTMSSDKWLGYLFHSSFRELSNWRGSPSTKVWTTCNKWCCYEWKKSKSKDKSSTTIFAKCTRLLFGSAGNLKVDLQAINLLVALDKAIIARMCWMQEAFSRDNKTWAPIGIPHCFSLGSMLLKGICGDRREHVEVKVSQLETYSYKESHHILKWVLILETNDSLFLLSTNGLPWPSTSIIWPKILVKNNDNNNSDDDSSSRYSF